MTTKSFARLFGVAALCGAITVGMLLWRSSTSSAIADSRLTATAVAAATTIMLDDPDPYDLPAGTVIREVHVLGVPGEIVSATEWDGERSIEASIKALGTPTVNGNSRSNDDDIDWGDTVDLGAIYNAGTRTATIAFSTRLIVDLAPGEVIFTSNTMNSNALIAEMVSKDLRCKCRCECFGANCGGVTVTIPCGDAPTSGDCASLHNEFCDPPGECQGHLVDCERVYMADEI